MIPDARLEELFVRYWDGSLTPCQADEFAGCLRVDSTARARFRALCEQAVTAAELPDPPIVVPRQPGVTRRAVLAAGLAGASAGLAAGVGWLGSAADSGPDLPFTVSRVRGLANLVFPEVPRRIPFDGGKVPVGAILDTVESESVAVLRFIDGATVTLTNESSLRVLDAGWRLVLRRGSATADTRRGAESSRLVFDTSVTRLSRLNGSLCYIWHADAATEVGVESGAVTVTDFAGKPLDVVRTGEVLTVEVGGQRNKRRIPATTDLFEWSAPDRFPAGLLVGRQFDVPGEAVAPALWYDPYHSEKMYQIRSHGRWGRGFFRLHPDSVVSFRYRADRSGPGQFVLCVRENKLTHSDNAVLEWNGHFESTPPGEWRWVEVQAVDLLNNPHRPAFGPPWVAFHLVFNAYTADLGLRVAELRVTRPGGPASS